MSFALPRLNSFFYQYDIAWKYEIIGEVEINYTLKPREFSGLPLELNRTVPLIAINRASFVSEYNEHQVLIFIYGGAFKGAYSYNFRSPIYGSEGMLKDESYEETLIEHEILHTFGLIDHNPPHEKEYYSSCTMGNLYLGKIQLCLECLSKITFPSKRYTLKELGVIQDEGVPIGQGNTLLRALIFIGILLILNRIRSK